MSIFGVHRHPPLRAEGHLPGFDGATGWLNSAPLVPADLRGHVVLVDFWTLTCINWLRTEPYVRAWSRAYRDDGLVVVGVHTPEFSFEHDIERVRRATERASDRLPGRARQRLRGLARLRQPLLAGALPRRPGRRHPRPPLRRRALRAVGARDPAAARRSSATSSPSKRPAWRRRPTGTTCARPRPTSATHAAERQAPLEHLQLNQWGLAGEWTTGAENVVLERAGGSIAFRFHARDAHLVLSRKRD